MTNDNQLVLPGMKRSRIRSGRQARDSALEAAELAVKKKWFEDALLVVERVALLRDDFTADDVRSFHDSYGFTCPSEGRVWGAVMMQAIRRGMIEKTGEYRQSTRKTNHARPIPIYVMMQET